MAGGSGVAAGRDTPAGGAERLLQLAVPGPSRPQPPPSPVTVHPSQGLRVVTPGLPGTHLTTPMVVLAQSEQEETSPGHLQPY